MHKTLTPTKHAILAADSNSGTHSSVYGLVPLTVKDIMKYVAVIDAVSALSTVEEATIDNCDVEFCNYEYGSPLQDEFTDAVNQALLDAETARFVATVHTDREFVDAHDCALHVRGERIWWRATEEHSGDSVFTAPITRAQLVGLLDQLRPKVDKEAIIRSMDEQWKAQYDDDIEFYPDEFDFISEGDGGVFVKAYLWFYDEDATDETDEDEEL